MRKWSLKYANKGEDLDDIIQVANIGVLHALERFEPSKGFKFKTFAHRTVMGEIKKYFRDYAWSFKVSRDIKETSVKLGPAVEKLSQQLNRAPNIKEIADYLNKPEAKVAEAMAAKNTYIPTSLETTANEEDKSQLSLFLGKDDKNIEHFENQSALQQALKTIDEKLQKVLYYRYFKSLTQSEVGKKLGISQMHVSRLERTALNKLKKHLA